VKDTFQTTWRELIDDGLVDDKHSVLSTTISTHSPGWLRGLVNQVRDDRERCVRLAQH
jgi:hypothetical protein